MMIDRNRDNGRRDWDRDNDRDYGKRDKGDFPGRTENTLPDRDAPPNKK
jgi:hypothetical protein